MEKSNEARKYSSPKLKSLLEQISPQKREIIKVRMQVSARIEDLLEEKGWTKSKFAEKVNKHPSEITRWVSGTHNFSLETLTEIAIAFGIGTPELFESVPKEASVKYELVVKYIFPAITNDLVVPSSFMKFFPNWHQPIKSIAKGGDLKLSTSYTYPETAHN